MPYDNLEYIDEKTAIAPKAITCIDNGLLYEMTPDELRNWYEENQSESALADAYAVAVNSVWWFGADADFYHDGTPEKEKAITIYDAWVSAEKEFKCRIHSILRSEGMDIPENGPIDMEIPFMERYGFVAHDLEWVEKE